MMHSAGMAKKKIQLKGWKQQQTTDSRLLPTVSCNHRIARSRLFKSSAVENVLKNPVLSLKTVYKICMSQDKDSVYVFKHLAALVKGKLTHRLTRRLKL